MSQANGCNEAIHRRKKDLQQEHNSLVAMSKMTQSIELSYFTDLEGWINHVNKTYDYLSPEELVVVGKFLGILSEASKAKVEPVDVRYFFMNHNLGLVGLNDKGNLRIVLLLEYLKYLEHVVKPQMKFNSLDDFLSVYERFKGHGEVQQLILMKTANWVAILLRYIPARKNKGLILTVVPKHVEGQQSRYVTGSGQTEATKDRVHIYELEGGVSRFRRQAPKRPRDEEGEDMDGASTASMTTSRSPETISCNPMDLDEYQLLAASLLQSLRTVTNIC